MDNAEAEQKKELARLRKAKADAKNAEQERVRKQMREPSSLKQ